MTTNLDVIKSALSLLGVVAEGQEPSAEQAELSLEVMNDIFLDWSEDGLEVGQWPQTDLSAAFPAESVQTCKSTLAVHLAPHFGKAPDPVTLALASLGRERLVRNAVRARLEPADTSGMPGGSGDWGYSDILNG
jgi:hypothetical protein